MITSTILEYRAYEPSTEGWMDTERLTSLGKGSFGVVDLYRLDSAVLSNKSVNGLVAVKSYDRASLINYSPTVMRRR